MFNLSTDQGIFMFPIMIGIGCTALLWLFRLLKTCVTERSKRYGYNALWILPFSLMTVCAIHPHGYFPSICISWIFVGWLFATACAILQKKISIKKSWKWILEETMRRTICTVDEMRSSLLGVNKKWIGLSRWKQILWILSIVGIGLLIMVINQDTVCLVSVGWWILFAFFTMFRCIHSCKGLVFFWFTYALASAVLLACMIGDRLPNGIVNDVAVYCTICAVLTGFWCISAVVSDFDAAKLAGATVNTTTTIMLLGVNIFFATLQRQFGLMEASNYDSAIYVMNVALFPIVAAGYLAMLLVDIAQYSRKRGIAPKR